MNLVYCGDLHLDAMPTSRIDDFEATKKEVIKEIQQVAKDVDAKAIIEGGDLFSKDTISSKELSKIISMCGFNSNITNDIFMDIQSGKISITEAIKRIKDDMPMLNIGVLGNHEVIGGEPSTYMQSSIGVLISSGFIKLASVENPIYLKDDDGFTVAVTGSNYNHKIDNADKSAYIIKEKLGDFHIHIVHGMLMNKSYGKLFKHTVIDEIAYDTKADLTINGHDHIGYPLTEIKGKYFVNPGSPLRLSAAENEINRMPKILIINVSSKGLEIKEHYLKCAKDGHMVLSRAKIEAMETRKKKIKEIKALIDKVKMNKGIDITDIIDKIGEAEGLSNDIINKTIKLITDKMDKLHTDFNPVGKYSIKRVEIDNFCSHKHSVLEFTEGLNVLTGNSRNGKSAVLEAIKEVYECNIRDLKNWIFYGENYLKITLYLSNGYIVSRIFESKKNGRNGYEVFNPNTGNIEFYNTKALPMVQEILGFNKIKLAEKNKVNINFTSQKDGWFFIGSGLSAPDKAKLIGIIYGTNYADAVSKDINTKNKKIISTMNIYKDEIKQYKEEEKSYEYINPLNDAVEEAESLMIIAKEMSDKIDKAKKLVDELKNIEDNIKVCDNILTKINDNEEYTKLLDEAVKIDDNIRAVNTKNQELRNIVNAGKESRKVIEALVNIDNLSDMITNVELIQADIDNKKESLNKFITLDKDCKALKENINILDEIDKKIPDTTEIENQIKGIEQTEKNITDAKKLFNEMYYLKKDINSTEAEEIKQEKIYTDYCSEYKKLLLELKICPICGNPIDESHADDIVSSL